MKITKTLLAVSVAALFAAPSAFATPLTLTDGDMVKLDWSSPPSYGHAYGGGEFELKGTSPADIASDSFLTFCIEFPEHIALDTSYYVHLNTAAVLGGGGAVPIVGTHAYDPSATTYDPLSTSTAWLYTQFRNNALSGFSYSGTTAQKNTSANSLQLAIWKLEDELTTSAAISAGAASAYSSDAQAKSWVYAATHSGWTNLGKVRVLNLYDTYNKTTGVFSGRHQDQLYLMPVPEPETYAMLLAGLGLMGFVARRRKQQLAA